MPYKVLSLFLSLSLSFFQHPADILKYLHSVSEWALIVIAKSGEEKISKE